MIWHSMNSFRKFNPEINLILSIPENFVEKWEVLCGQYSINIDHKIVVGGATRAETVLKAITSLPDEGQVLVHDAARPCLKTDLIRRILKEVKIGNCAVPVIQTNESMAKVKLSHFERLDRSQIVTVQTPQAFDLAKYKNAYLQHYDGNATDESEILQQSGVKITAVNGDETNIKVTFPYDLKTAESILNNEN